MRIFEETDKRREKSDTLMMERMETRWLRHFTAFSYALDKASKEGRSLSPNDLKEGLQVAKDFEEMKET